MDHLSSCYFCGAALDEPLGAYAVDSSGGEPSVTLCASCRHKLDRLLNANDLGETVPAEPDANGAETEDGGETAADKADSTEPVAGADGDTETSGTALSTDTGAETEKPPERTGGERAEGSDQSEPADEWTPDPDQWSGPDQQPSESRSAADRSPEPITTNPEELPDDEEIKEVPGLAVDDDDSASRSWETDIQDEMQPNVPDAFADTDAETGTESADLEADAETAAEGDSADSDEREGVGPELDSHDDPLAPESSGRDEGDASPETADGEQFESEEPPVSEGGIDPSILQADEIATGAVDVEEALDGEIGLPDELATDPEESEGSDTERSADDRTTGNPGANGEEAVDSEDVNAEDPFDLDTETEGSGTTESTEPEIEESETEASASDDGDFDFDDEPGMPPDEDETLHSEMEADIPEELRTAESDDSMDAVADDLEAIDSMDSEDDTADTAEVTPSDEEAEFDDERDERSDADETPSGSELMPSESAADDSAGAEQRSETGSARPGPDASDAGDESADRRRSISALEYNKVMRLLQNREFPVDRMELMAVAASTYDLAEADCAAVLDTAIDRGLLAEDGDTLIKPD
ncbi:MAG: hypothetical protein ACI8TL_000194 [Natronomonas sp.]|jgi:hypothetical protein